MATHSDKKLEIKPYTELLPDVYKIDKPLSVHIFSGEKDQHHCPPLISSLESCRNEIDIKQYSMDTRKSVEAILDELRQVNYEDTSGFLLVMMGNALKSDELGVLYTDDDNKDPINIESIWRRFVCVQSLRKKPKIFLIQATEYKPTQEPDSMLLNDSLLSIPFEADFMIAYKNLYSSDSGKFINAISEKISTFGHRDDIVSIITLLDNKYDCKIPRIISTLTRKFYFKSNTFRGYSLDISGKINKIENGIKDLQKSLQHVDWKKIGNDSQEILPERHFARRVFQNICYFIAYYLPFINNFLPEHANM